MDLKKVSLGIHNEDRISSLPDCILSHILSFVPTKYSVRTAVLSTRWKKLFTFVNNLDFEFHTYPPHSTASSTTEFIHFVSSVFISYNVSRMNKFCFSFWTGQQPPEHFPLFSWISSVIERRVKKIKIIFPCCAPTALPLDLFSCKTLTSLTLQGRFNIVLPRSVCLPCLKSCSFIYVSFDDESARRLFRSCPVLEYVDITCCYTGEGVDVFDISVPTLKSLSIHEPGGRFQVVLNVPNLLHFDYEGPASKEFLGLKSLKSVFDARICCHPDSSNKVDVLVELVFSVSHVQQLYLNCDVMEDFLSSRHTLPIFSNLTRMRLGPISCFASRLLPDLLDNAALLEFLSFEGSQAEYNEGDENNYLLPEHVPACVSLRLKEVEFKYFFGMDYDCKLIKYFLKYAKNLKVMKVQTKLSWSEHFEISPAACQIVLYSDEL